MNKRNTQQRRRQIVEQLNANGELSVDQLAAQFNISEVTIRKDLTSLESAGLLFRRYGGAIAVPQDFVANSNTADISACKMAIAKAAAGLIKDHYRIIIDSGSTTAALLPQLASKQGLVVMTNSLIIANALRELENEPTLLMTGGTWDAQSESFQGQLAEQILRSYDFDQLFIGADSIDLARGTTTYNELCSLSQAMAEVSREIIVMMESAKLGRKIHNLELPWSVISVLITDTGLPEQDARQIEQQGVKVIRVQPI